jgi:predicted HTH transcriptional regulator
VIDNFLRYGDANRAMTRFVIDSISHGENKNREFKETFQKDVNLSKKSKDISLSVVKTIAAFANTDGGDLFVGVSDDMKIKGIENDFYTNDDKYLLTFYQVVESALGAAAIGMIDAQIKFIQGVKILWVKVIAAQDPVYCNYHTSRGDFFVRQGPLTKNLNPQEADQYRQVRVHKN